MGLFFWLDAVTFHLAENRHNHFDNLEKTLILSLENAEIETVCQMEASCFTAKLETGIRGPKQGILLFKS